MSPEQAFSPEWWVPVPLRVDPATGEYQVTLWKRDTRYLSGKCVVSRHPIHYLTERAVLTVLNDYWPEFSWAWVGAWGGFYRRNMALAVGGRRQS
jgi:hypothetical protein